MVAKKNWKRFTKFVSTGLVAFLFSELIIYLGLTIFGYEWLIEIDFFSAVFSIALGFYLNDKWTTRNHGFHPKGVRITAIRLLGYEAIYSLGNLIAYTIQLILYYFVGINPLIGNFLGAIAAVPFNYLFTMNLIWRIDLRNN
ncbi:MAG: GtrA family protein [Thermoplasmataceae archaeon]